MRLDGAIFAIEQRSVGRCLDLAMVFMREHCAAVYQLVLCFAIPSVVATWCLTTYAEWTIFGCAVLFGLVTPFCGAALAAAGGHRVFGDRFSTRNGMRQLLKRLFLVGFLCIVTRLLTGLGIFVLVFPALIVAARYGFLAEVLLLEQCPGKRYESRVSDLLSGRFWEIIGRLIWVLLFFVMAVVALFTLVDFGCDLLFGWPILYGRLSGESFVTDELYLLLEYDPRVIAVLVSIMWVVYPFTRLAWMFCYLDSRIRKEGWDVELNFRVEARRLGVIR